MNRPLISDAEILGEAPPDDGFHDGWDKRWLRFGRDIESIVRRRLAKKLRDRDWHGYEAMAARIVESGGDDD